MPHADGPGTTDVSLLVRLRGAAPGAWESLVELYGPLLSGWCRRAGLSEADAQDVVQEVFQALIRGLSTFRKERPSDTFRGWLRVITRRKLVDFWRRRADQPIAIGGSTNLLLQGQIEDVLPEIDEPGDLQRLVQRALTHVRTQFSEEAVQAFVGTAVAQRPAAEVGKELGMTANAVGIAKLRVSRALRLALGDLDPACEDEPERF